MEHVVPDFEVGLLGCQEPTFLWNRLQVLVGVPMSELAEAPSSWITRAALTQGVTVDELRRFLGLPNDQDFDLSFARARRSQVAIKCGLPEDSFVFMHRMFSRLLRIDKAGRTYLLEQDGFPRYRYCHKCLADQREKSFPLHWRFKAWRWCPVHNSILCDRCPHCSAFVVLPNDQVKGGGRRKGVAKISDCFVCGESLYSGRLENRFDPSRANLSLQDWMLVRNGRALLAALFHGFICFDGNRKTRKLRNLNALAMAGLFPHDAMHYERADGRYVKYRNPHTHALVHINKEPAESPTRRPWMAGLFDG